MDLRCTTDKYDILYARWLQDPGALLDAAGYVPGMQVLDLCGGTGAIALECLRRGADPATITLVDLNPRCPDTRVTQHQGDANNLGGIFAPKQPGCWHTFDRVIIRQAAAYLHWASVISWLWALMARESQLVFNIFIKPRWAFKTYRYEGRRYFEASGYLGRTVYHLQASPTVGMDISQFQWLDLERLYQQLTRHLFTVEIQDRGRSQTWICTRRGKTL